MKLLYFFEIYTRKYSNFRKKKTLAHPQKSKIRENPAQNPFYRTQGML